MEIRLECVQNAIDQAKHAALAMLGRPKTYSEVPWFWSDQYDLKLQIAGLARPSDQLVLRGDPASRKFAVFHLRDGVVAAVEAVLGCSCSDLDGERMQALEERHGLFRRGVLALVPSAERTHADAEDAAPVGTSPMLAHHAGMRHAETATTAPLMRAYG